MFIRASSVFDLALDLTSHSPAWCWGKKQWTKWIFVRLNCSHNPSTWNLTCNATELRLMPACPLVNVRRMEDMRRRLWLPSRPATDPDKEVIGPRLVKKRSDIWGLLDSCKKMVKNHCIHDRNLREGTTYKDTRTGLNHILRYSKGKIPFQVAFLTFALIRSKAYSNS